MLIVNLFVDGVILWAGSQLAPGTVQINGIGALIWATILFSLNTSVIVYLCRATSNLGLIFNQYAWIFASFVVVLFSGVIALTLLSSWLPGFAIVGFWPKVLICILCSIFELGDK